MYCHKCGNQIEEGSKFCHKCGQYVVTNTEETKGTPLSTVIFLKPNEELGKFWYRFGAYVIDFAIAMVGGWVLLGFIFYTINPDTTFFDTLTGGATSLLSFVLHVLYHSIALSIWSTTIGKSLFGLRIVGQQEGRKIHIGQAIGRSLSYFFSSLVFGIGFLNIISDKKKQGWHDRIAGTLVVRDTNKNITLGVIFTIIAIIIFVWFSTWFSMGTVADEYNNYEDTEPTQNSLEQEQETEDVSSTYEKIIVAADYQEGYKAGYADGRSIKGTAGDNYMPPATEERNVFYTLGYLEGFLLGCGESNFDCSEVEKAIQEIYTELDDEDTDIELIPPDVKYEL